MNPFKFILLIALLLPTFNSFAETTERKQVYVVPVEGAISGSIEFVIRRAAKEAQEKGIDALLLDIDTPGGALGNTIEIMKILDRFEGDTIAYINEEAMSAGAYISISTDEIYFTENAIIGAAEAIQSSGEDINESMKRKLNSYMRAKVRVYSKNNRYRADVMRAMMDDKFVFKIGDKEIKAEGELLSLTADEAVSAYGEPPENLLGEGIHSSIEELLKSKYGEGNYEIKEFKITWSEEIAKYLEGIAPILLSLGLLLLFIEFKTPGFGVFGISGISILVIVFISNYVAALAGYEPIIFLCLGFLLVMAELLFFPGTILPAFIGILFIFGSIIWSLTDIWPNSPTPEGLPGGWNLEWAAIKSSSIELLFSLTLTCILFALLYRFLPKTWVWNKMILETKISANCNPILNQDTQIEVPEIGSKGVALSKLQPGGEVEIDGKRYEARLEVGLAQKGTKVCVIGKKDFTLIVSPEETQT